MKLTKEQWKSDQAARKSELKEIAKEIKKLKPIFKDSQRELTRTQRQYNLERNISRSSIQYDPSIISMVKDIYIKAVDKMREHQVRLDQLRKDYRFKHLIYCLYNGTPEDKIERCRDEYKFKCESYEYMNEIKQAKMYQLNWGCEQEVLTSTLTEEPVMV